MQKSLSLITVIFITGFFSLHAQNRIPVEKGKAIKNSVILMSDLRDVDHNNPPTIKAPNKDLELPDLKVNPKDVIYREPVNAYTSNNRSVNETSPPPDTSFNALDDPGNIIPPDVNGAAGPDHLMITLNTQIRIQEKNGTELFTTHLGTFWASMPNDGGTFDPKILYDPYEERWIIVTCSSSDPNLSKLYFGVSNSSNPLGEWNLYWIDTDVTNVSWFDYPSFGFNKKWITISGNMFGGDYYSTVYVIDKMAAYNGDENPDYTRFTTTQGFTLVPQITFNPDFENMYLISTSNGNSGGYGYINMFKVSGELNNPVFEFKGSIGVPEPWENSAGNYGNFLPQLGSSEKINSVDSRMENVIFRNNKLWAVHHIFLPVNNPQRVAVQLWELDTTGTILNRYRIQDTTNVYSFAFPTVAVNANEDILVGHNVFSLSQYAGAAYSFKPYYEDGNSFRTYYQFKEGETPYVKTFGSGRNRWGDYSGTCVDPSNGYDFWTIQEYAASPENSWGTWWAKLKPSFSPIADFIGDEILIPVGETVNFTDLTEGVPSNWNWSFESGTPSASSEQNPKDIQFNEEGSFSVQLIASNELGTDTITKEAYITTSSTLLPEVDFTADKNNVCVGEPVSFFDQSLYSPIQWEWQFDPSDVTFEEGTDQNSQNPTVSFNQPGSYAVTLTVWNLNGSSNLTKFDMVFNGGFIPYFNETFEENDLSLNSWTVENPDNSTTWQLFEVGGSGSGHLAAGIDLNHYYVYGQRDRLFSPLFNLEGMNSAVLEFQHAYAKHYDEITDSLIVYVSGDCGENWTKVFAGGDDGSGNFATHEKADSFWPETADDWCGSGYGASCTNIDLSPWVGQANVRIAFESYCSYGNPLFIDNIQISQYVGQTELKNNEADVSVFPNPSDGTFTILLTNNKNLFNHLEIFNQLGQVVRQIDIENNTNSLDINTDNNLKAGIYFIKLTGKTEPVSKRIIIF